MKVGVWLCYLMESFFLGDLILFGFIEIDCKVFSFIIDNVFYSNCMIDLIRSYLLRKYSLLFGGYFFYMCCFCYIIVLLCKLD